MKLNVKKILDVAEIMIKIIKDVTEQTKPKKKKKPP